MWLLSASLFTPTDALAETTTFDLNVQTTLVATCTFTTSRLDIDVPRGSTTYGVGTTNFTVSCPGASAVSPVPVRFSFAPQDGSSQFVLRTLLFPRQMPYELCYDQTCNTTYQVGVAGPPISVDRSTFTYALWGRAYAPASGATIGLYRQVVDVTMMY